MLPAAPTTSAWALFAIFMFALWAFTAISERTHSHREDSKS